MKRICQILFILFMSVVMGGLVGCATLFPEPVPLCTPEEQETSIIYGFLSKIQSNPTATDFSLLMVSASQLPGKPLVAAELINAATKLKTALVHGITYSVFAATVKEELEPLQYVVASKMLQRFETIHIPIEPCDKRLIIGHLDNQIELAQMVK